MLVALDFLIDINFKIAIYRFVQFRTALFLLLRNKDMGIKRTIYLALICSLAIATYFSLNVLGILNWNRMKSSIIVQ